VQFAYHVPPVDIDRPSMLRIPTRPQRKDPEKQSPPADGRALLAAQDFSRGLVAAAVAAVAGIALWVWAGMLFDRYFPWVSMLQGMLIGLSMRRFGRGVEPRFPVAAALVAAAAAVLGSFVNALFLTGREFGTGVLALVDEISWYTVTTFLERDFGVVGLIYMFFAAALAAFYANRRLRRGEAAALRRVLER